MIIRHCLSKTSAFLPRRSFVITPFLNNELQPGTIEATSNTDQEASTNRASKRIFLKPDQIKNRKRKNNGKRMKSISRQQSQSASSSAKVDLALIQELYRKNNNLASSSSDEDGDSFRYIETLKPFESKIGSKRYEELTRDLYNAFKKNQIINYMTNLRSKTPDLPALKPRLNKSQIIESLLTHYWKIVKQKSDLSGEELLSNRIIELTPAQRFLIDPKRSRFIRNLIASNIKVQLGKTKLSVTALKSELDYVEAELVQVNNRIKSEEIDLSIIKGVQKSVLDFGEISNASLSYFEKLDKGKYKILANTQANINTAKRLILWALDCNPHVQTLFFNKSAIENAHLLPFINEDVWPWCDKHARYYSMFYEDRRPGRDSDLVFEKFDKMNDKFLKSKSLEDLVDQKLALKANKNSFIDEALSDEILGMFKTIGKPKEEAIEEVKPIITCQSEGNTTSQSDNEKEPNEKIQKEFDLDRIIKNRHESAATTNDHEQLLNLEALRHELGNFEDGLKIEDFPDVSNLIVDAEKQTSDEVLEILRTELGAFAEDDGSVVDDGEDISSSETSIDKGNLHQKYEVETDIESSTTSNSIPESKNSTIAGEALQQQSAKKLPFTEEQVVNLYTQLNDLSFANGLQGASKDAEPYSAYTIQFGSLLFKQNKDPQAEEPSREQLLQAQPDQFKFLTSIPFFKDLATSLPILYNGNQTFTNKMQIRLVPSIYHSPNDNLDSSKTLQDCPPVEIQADLNDWGRIKLETLQVLSIEAMNNIYVAMPQLASDLQVSKFVIGDLLQPQTTQDNHKQQQQQQQNQQNQQKPGISFDNQPHLSQFLEDSQLSFGGQVKVKPSSSIELCVNGKFVKYDFVHLTYKTDLLFDLNGRELCLSIIEGGNFGGRRFEVMLGEGELSRNEFAKFLNDAIEFCSEI
ncbi:SLS1 [Candida margitis]|uniref:SLS1 n=1 Tax=Candida margitis TaxID=1775924 RepID=UPI002227D85D|nr:SLS1 [Candida margitis]KAI5968984.1 SLS1 [Candida margitis]